MKSKITLLMLVLGLGFSQLFAQTASVQVIHNSADAAAAEVDVYINDAKALDNFAFRTATPFIDLPAGVPVKIDIAPATSVSSAESVYSMTTTLSAGEKYILVALGIPTFVREIASSSIKIKAYPNPATDFLNLSFDLDNSSDVSIEFYNVLGSRVYQQSLGYMWAGFNEARVDVTNLPSGIYVATLKNGNNQSTVRVKITR